MNGDLQREELLKTAQQAIELFKAEKHMDAQVKFKFTCEKCGQRCTLVEPNVLYERGDCFKCGHSTKIEKGGFALIIKLGDD